MVTVKVLLPHPISLSPSPSPSPSRSLPRLPPASSTHIDVYCHCFSKHAGYTELMQRTRETRTQERTSQEWLSWLGILSSSTGSNTGILPEHRVLGTLRASKWFSPGCLFLVDEWGHMCSDRTWHVFWSLFAQAPNEGDGLFWLFPAAWELC